MLSRERLDRAKLFTSGGSQAVRLPKEYRFEGEKEIADFAQDGGRDGVQALRSIEPDP